MDGSFGTTFDARSTIDTLTKTTEKITSFSQGNFEALTKSGQIWAAGCQAISKTLAATTQAHFDQSMSTLKTLMAVKSMKDVADLRTSILHTSFASAFAEAGKLTDETMKLAEQALAPITARITVAVEQFKPQVS